MSLDRLIASYCFGLRAADRRPTVTGQVRSVARTFTRTFERRLRPDNGPSRFHDSYRVVDRSWHQQTKLLNN
jgi:hypothetical protein